MENILAKNAINFKYTIKNVLNEDISYEESFIPYSIKELKSSPLFSIIENKYKSLFNDDTKFESKADYHFLDEPKDEYVLPETTNILMDAIYCTYVASLNFININNSIRFYSDNVYFVNIYENQENICSHNVKFFTSEKYMAIYTELIKDEVCEIKYIISVLYWLYNLKETINNELANEFLQKLKNEYFAENIVLDIFNKSSIENSLLSFCNYRNFQSIKNKFELEFDFKRFDRFISLLKKYRGDWSKADFTKGKNCFCLVHEGKSYYFSLSGYSNNYEDLGDKIANDFKGYFPNNSFQFCKIHPDMLSYGNKIFINKLVKFSSPKKFCEQKNIGDDNLKSQYSCCERKIFPYVKEKSNKMYIYCKYEPCIRCKPAIKEMKKIYSNFRFYAFEKDSAKFKRQIIKKKKILLKQQNIVRNDYFE